MTTAVAVVGLTFSGTDIQQLDSIFLEIRRGLGEVVDVRGVDLVVPSRAGQIVRNRVGHRLSILLEGYVRGVGMLTSGETAESSDRDAFATNRAALRALFDPTAAPAALLATLEDGTSQTIDARTLNIVFDELVPTHHRVSIEMESVDPDWVAGGS